MTATTATTAIDPLQASDPSDMIALTISAFGYTPTDSLVIIGIQPTGTTGALVRMDLEDVLERPVTLATSYASLLSNDHDACVALSFRATPPAPPEITPSAKADAEALRELQAGFDAVGMPLPCLWQVGGGYARLANCSGVECCPYPGDPVDTSSSPACELIPETETTPAEVLARYVSAAPDPLYAEEIAETPTCPQRGLHRFAALVAGEITAEEMTTSELADLLAALDEDHAPAVLALTVSGLSSAWDLLAAPAGDTGLPETHQSPAPDWARIDRLADALQVIAAYATQATAARLYSLMGWISYAKGQTTLQDLFTAAALHTDDTNQLTADVSALAHTGVAGWARRAETAYRPTR